MTYLLAYDYVRRLLEEEFLAAYLRFNSLGILHYELTSMLEVCAPLLKGLDQDDRFLRLEMTGMIANYLDEV